MLENEGTTVTWATSFICNHGEPNIKICSEITISFQKCQNKITVNMNDKYSEV